MITPQVPEVRAQVPQVSTASFAMLVTPTVTPTKTPTVTPTQTPSLTPPPTPSPTTPPSPSAIPAAVPTPAPGSCRFWSDPATWGLGRAPNATDDLFIPAGSSVCLDGLNNVARTLTVEGVLTKQAGENVTLSLGGNLHCRGTSSAIRMPNGLPAASAPWTIRFLVNSEAQFVGGGMAVLASDTGLWVTGGCRLELEGSAKTSWTRLGTQAMAGATTVNVLAANGWRVNDELAIAPTESSTVPGAATHFDEVGITAISGTTVTLNRPLTYAHPSAQVRPGVWYGAEVMNLTRSGNIEGRPGECATNPAPACRALRSHIWIMNDRPTQHRISYITVRWMGPQQCFNGPCTADGQNSLVENLGRYPIHFHMNRDFSNGTLVDGVVIRNFGAHAQVSHDSNGITWRDGVMYDGYATASWWDSAEGVPDRCNGCPRPAEPRGLQILHNIAANLKFVPSFRGYALSGFFVGRQDGNIWRDNVATGVLGNETCSGFSWPEFSHGVANFSGSNVAHNTNCTGLFAWQNDSLPHLIRDFVAYHNRFTGILHGAYLNLYVYQDVTLYANGDGTDAGSNLELHAMSQPPEAPAVQLQFINTYMDAAGRPWNVKTAAHALAGRQPVRFIGGTMMGASRANINLAATPSISGSLDDWLQVDANVTMVGNRYWLNDNIDANSRIVDVGLRLTFWRRDQSGRCSNGSLRPEANAWACPN